MPLIGSGRVRVRVQDKFQTINGSGRAQAQDRVHPSGSGFSAAVAGNLGWVNQRSFIPNTFG